MAVCNDEDYLAESIESILRQSFEEFELLIIDYGSTDNTKAIIRSYRDERIYLIDGCDYIQSLNIGLKAAKGKYFVHMNSDDIMHVDRLKLHYSTMEEFSEITVCNSWTIIFGKNMNRRIADECAAGVIGKPLLKMIDNDIIFNNGSMVRHSFMTEHQLVYENYAYAEDFKLSVEIAKLGGAFYMETQPLLYKRMTDTKISRKQRSEKLRSISKIKREILGSLCGKNEAYPVLAAVCNSYFELASQELVSDKGMFEALHSLFIKNANKLNM